jgi:hypothetical protein
MVLLKGYKLLIKTIWVQAYLPHPDTTQSVMTFHKGPDSNKVNTGAIPTIITTGNNILIMKFKIFKIKEKIEKLWFRASSNFSISSYHVIKAIKNNKVSKANSLLNKVMKK